MSMSKYQVERRPMATGTAGTVIVRGLKAGDYVKVQNGAATVEDQGEPWIVHSTHYSLDSAVASAAPLASAMGAENLRIVKVVTGQTVFKLN